MHLASVLEDQLTGRAVMTPISDAKILRDILGKEREIAVKKDQVLMPKLGEGKLFRL